MSFYFNQSKFAEDLALFNRTKDNGNEELNTFDTVSDTIHAIAALLTEKDSEGNYKQTPTNMPCDTTLLAIGKVMVEALEASLEGYRDDWEVDPDYQYGTRNKRRTG